VGKPLDTGKSSLSGIYIMNLGMVSSALAGMTALGLALGANYGESMLAFPITRLAQVMAVGTLRPSSP